MDIMIYRGRDRAKWLHIKFERKFSDEGELRFNLVWRVFELEVPGSIQEAILPLPQKDAVLKKIMKKNFPMGDK
jgi:hypothetical protein